MTFDRVIFARTRYQYDSYFDYWAIVEASGFEWQYIDEIDYHQNNALVIVSPMNGEWRPQIEHERTHFDVRCTLAHWLLERPSGSGGMQNYVRDNLALVDGGYIDVILTSDLTLQAALGNKAVYTPMGSADIASAPPGSPQYDFVAMMAYSPRRAPYFDGYDRVKWQHDGMRFAPNANPYRKTALRDALLRTSKFGLAVHQDDYAVCEPLRLALFAAYRLPILSETFQPQEIYGGALQMTSLDDLMLLGYEMIHAYPAWKDWGQWLYERMTGPFSFRSCLERVL